MRIAIPTTQGELEEHFGHCEEFALVDTDAEGSAIASFRLMTAPTHAPGMLPQWLNQQGVELVIAGNMGGRAQALLSEMGIAVLMGAPQMPPDFLVRSYLQGQLVSEPRICAHTHGEGAGDHEHCGNTGGHCH